MKGKVHRDFPLKANPDGIFLYKFGHSRVAEGVG